MVRTPKSKASQSVRSKWGKDTDQTEDDDEEDLDEIDFDLAIKITRERKRQRRVQDKEENKAFNPLYTTATATKLTFEQIIALAKYHIKHAAVIQIQQEASISDMVQAQTTTRRNEK